MWLYWFPARSTAEGPQPLSLPPMLLSWATVGKGSTHCGVPALTEPHSGLIVDSNDPSSLFSAGSHWEMEATPPSGGKLSGPQDGEGMVPPVGSRGQPVPYPFQEDTISINHNWVNGCNLANMWHFLQQELCAVQQEIIEWRDSMPDWHHHCQVGQRV